MRNPKFSEQEWKQIRAEEIRLLSSMLAGLKGERLIVAEASARGRINTLAKKARVPEVGLFFVVNGKPKPFVDGIAYTEVPSYAGFRTYSVDHDKFWAQLQRIGAVPTDVDYDEVARGRVTYEDSSRTFTLFADKHVIKDKKAISYVMSQFNLPNNTKVLTDDHYKCPKCLSKRTKKQKEDDWNF